MDLGLADDTALLTASTRGLGLASARAFARAGANVAVCGSTADSVENARETLEADATDGNVLVVQADITDSEELDAFVATTADRFDGIDHVVTSAGGVPSGPFLELDRGEWQAAYELLVLSHVQTVAAAAPQLMASSSGTITAITSTTVREPIDGLVLSNAVRRAVVGAVKTVAREFAPEVRANVVLPGPYATSRIESLIEQAVERGEYESRAAGRNDWARDVPLGRVGDPQELGDVVAFLASDRASFLTGVALPVDGGRLRS